MNYLIGKEIRLFAGARPLQLHHISLLVFAHLFFDYRIHPIPLTQFYNPYYIRSSHYPYSIRLKVRS